MDYLLYMNNAIEDTLIGFELMKHIEEGNIYIYSM